MPRLGHNRKVGGVVEGARSLGVMKLARSGCLTDSRLGTWRWTYPDGTTASIIVVGGRDAVTLDYRIRTHGKEAESVQQRVPIRWTPCRFGGERRWFVCDVSASGVYCGRQVVTLYGAGRLFACRHCYRLGYRVQRGGPMDRAHLHLGRLHRKLSADYDGPDGPPPPRPKWMRHRTYDRVVQQIEAGVDRLDAAFMVGAERFLARVEGSKQRRGMRR